MFSKPRQQNIHPSPLSGTLHQRVVRRATAGFRYLGFHDPLTALPSRRRFKNRLEKILKDARMNDRTVAVLLLSVDAHKRIDVMLGRDFADQLKRWAAGRLKQIVSGDNLVSYCGGDEFVIVLRNNGHFLQTAEIVADLQHRFEASLVLAGSEFYITSSVGVAVCPAHGLSVDVLLKNAAAALLRARECGGDSFRIYAEAINSETLARLTLDNSMRRALEHNEFRIHYQPQIDNTTWRVTGVEALIRWQHPRLGLLSPAQFIPLAEETGLIVAIGEWVLRTACRQLKSWHVDGMRDLNLAVNVSARQFQQSDPAEMIARLLRELALDPRYLTLELTESSLIANCDSVNRALARLSELGVKLALDDFGKGFSSFEYLTRLPLDVLKIDESFVRNATLNLDDAAVLSTIIALGHKLRLQVIAEGLETEEQLRILNQFNCNAMQGFVFCEPLAPDQFKRWATAAGYKLGGFAPGLEDLSRRIPTDLRLLNNSLRGTRLAQLAHG